MLEVSGSQVLASFLPLSSIGSTSTTLITYSESVLHTSKSASNRKHIENKRKIKSWNVAWQGWESIENWNQKYIVVQNFLYGSVVVWMRICPIDSSMWSHGFQLGKSRMHGLPEESTPLWVVFEISNLQIIPISLSLLPPWLLGYEILAACCHTSLPWWW